MKDQHPSVLRIQGERPIDQIWMQLQMYESASVAKRLIERRALEIGRELKPDLLDAKAVGVAYAIRSAREYLLPASPEWTKRILTTYYGLMSLLTAILVADPASDDDLKAVEHATQGGHGAKTAVDPEAPDGFVAIKVYVASKGLFPKCLKQLGVDSKTLHVSRYLETWEASKPEDRARMVSLDSLLARIPAIATIYAESVNDRDDP